MDTRKELIYSAVCQERISMHLKQFVEINRTEKFVEKDDLFEMYSKKFRK